MHIIRLAYPNRIHGFSEKRQFGGISLFLGEGGKPDVADKRFMDIWTSLNNSADHSEAQ